MLPSTLPFVTKFSFTIDVTSCSNNPIESVAAVAVESAVVAVVGGKDH